MKLPKKIKVGGVWYRVVRRKIDDDSMGQCEFDASEIIIRDSLNDEQALTTLIHEIIHCVNNQLGEQTTEFLAQALYQILKDNKFIT